MLILSLKSPLGKVNKVYMYVCMHSRQCPKLVYLVLNLPQQVITGSYLTSVGFRFGNSGSS